MFRPPEDVEGECNARLFLFDDWGSNDCTVRCKLSPNHEGLHKESFLREGKQVIITWEYDERKDR